MAALAACGATTGAKASAPWETKAQAFERGTGGARDYHAAAEVYREACKDGRGDSLACGALIRAELRGRGIARDERAAATLASTLCRTRHDPFGCMVAHLYVEGRTLDERLRGISTETGRLGPCTPADLSTCHARVIALVFDGRNGGDARARRRNEALAFCRADLFEACSVGLRHWGPDDDDAREARGRLQAGCDRGDADACASSPQREPIKLDLLCKASDYEACATLGCEGDAAAKALAVGHGIPDDGCGAPPPPHRMSVAEVIAKMGDFRDKMCACANRACADQVTEAMTQWGQDMAKQGDLDRRVTEAETKAIATATEDLTKCMTKLITNDAP